MPQNNNKTWTQDEYNSKYADLQKLKGWDDNTTKTYMDDYMGRNGITVAQPAPSQTTPAPVSSQPAPVTSQPAPVGSQPAPVTSQPTTGLPSPTAKQTTPKAPVNVRKFDTPEDFFSDREAVAHLSKMGYNELDAVKFLYKEGRITKFVDPNFAYQALGVSPELKHLVGPRESVSKMEKARDRLESFKGKEFDEAPTWKQNEFLMNSAIDAKRYMEARTGSLLFHPQYEQKELASLLNKWVKNTSAGASTEFILEGNEIKVQRTVNLVYPGTGQLLLDKNTGKPKKGIVVSSIGAWTEFKRGIQTSPVEIGASITAGLGLTAAMSPHPVPKLVAGGALFGVESIVAGTGRYIDTETLSMPPELRSLMDDYFKAEQLSSRQQSVNTLTNSYGGATLDTALGFVVAGATSIGLKAYQGTKNFVMPLVQSDSKIAHSMLNVGANKEIKELYNEVEQNNIRNHFGGVAPTTIEGKKALSDLTMRNMLSLESLKETSLLLQNSVIKDYVNRLKDARKITDSHQENVANAMTILDLSAKITHDAKLLAKVANRTQRVLVETGKKRPTEELKKIDTVFVEKSPGGKNLQELYNKATGGIHSHSDAYKFISATIRDMKSKAEHFLHPNYLFSALNNVRLERNKLYTKFKQEGQSAIDIDAALYDLGIIEEGLQDVLKSVYTEPEDVKLLDQWIKMEKEAQELSKIVNENTTGGAVKDNIGFLGKDNINKLLQTHIETSSNEFVPAYIKLRTALANSGDSGNNIAALESAFIDKLIKENTFNVNNKNSNQLEQVIDYGAIYNQLKQANTVINENNEVSTLFTTPENRAHFTLIENLANLMPNLEGLPLTKAKGNVNILAQNFANWSKIQAVIRFANKALYLYRVKKGDENLLVEKLLGAANELNIAPFSDEAIKNYRTVVESLNKSGNKLHEDLAQEADRLAQQIEASAQASIPSQPEPTQLDFETPVTPQQQGPDPLTVVEMEDGTTEIVNKSQIQPIEQPPIQEDPYGNIDLNDIRVNAPPEDPALQSLGDSFTLGMENSLNPADAAVAAASQSAPTPAPVAAASQPTPAPVTPSQPPLPIDTPSTADEAVAAAIQPTPAPVAPSQSIDDVSDDDLVKAATTTNEKKIVKELTGKEPIDYDSYTAEQVEEMEEELPARLVDNIYEVADTMLEAANIEDDDAADAFYTQSVKKLVIDAYDNHKKSPLGALNPTEQEEAIAIQDKINAGEATAEDLSRLKSLIDTSGTRPDATPTPSTVDDADKAVSEAAASSLTTEEKELKAQLDAKLLAGKITDQEKETLFGLVAKMNNKETNVMPEFVKQKGRGRKKAELSEEAKTNIQYYHDNKERLESLSVLEFASDVDKKKFAALPEHDPEVNEIMEKAAKKKDNDLKNLRDSGIFRTRLKKALGIRPQKGKNKINAELSDEAKTNIQYYHDNKEDLERLHPSDFLSDNDRNRWSVAYKKETAELIEKGAKIRRAELDKLKNSGVFTQKLKKALNLTSPEAQKNITFYNENKDIFGGLSFVDFMGEYRKELYKDASTPKEERDKLAQQAIEARERDIKYLRTRGEVTVRLQKSLNKGHFDILPDELKLDPESSEFKKEVIRKTKYKNDTPLRDEALKYVNEDTLNKIQSNSGLTPLGDYTDGISLVDSKSNANKSMSLSFGEEIKEGMTPFGVAKFIPNNKLSPDIDEKQFINLVKPDGTRTTPEEEAALLINTFGDIKLGKGAEKLRNLIEKALDKKEPKVEMHSTGTNVRGVWNNSALQVWLKAVSRGIRVPEGVYYFKALTDAQVERNQGNIDTFFNPAPK